jgi:hypothetical protein
MAIATKENEAIVRATNGKIGYNGTRNGLTR